MRGWADAKSRSWPRWNEEEQIIMRLRMSSPCTVVIGLLVSASASWAQPTNGNGNVNGVRSESPQKPASAPKPSIILKAGQPTAMQSAAKPGAVAGQGPMSRQERATRVSSKVLKSTQESASAVVGNMK
jgi:hypothetical protein